MPHESKTPFVLIIEDDRDVAAYYRHVMDMAGYRTEIIANGKVALEHLYNSAPDIVLLDLSLPGVSGVEVLKMIKSDARLRSTRVVVITGYSQIAASLPVEPDLIMMKPVGPGQLTDLTGRLFQDDTTMEKRPFGKSPWDRATGLYNRAFFFNRLNSALRSARKNPASRFGVLLISPPAGDRSLRSNADREKREALLQEIADILKSNMRPTDTLARFNRDHFYILAENLPGEETLTLIIGRIRAALEGRPAGISFEIGARLCDGAAEDAEQIIREVKLHHAQAGEAGSKVPDREAITKE